MNYIKIIILLIILFPISLFAQQRQIQMEYDDAGNRISQKIVYLPSRSRAIQTPDSTSNTTGYTNEKIGEYEIRVYPNPTKGVLKVQILGMDSEQNSSLCLFNSKGTLLIQQNLEEQEGTLDLSLNPSGVYILTVLVNGIQKEFKIIKE